MARVRKHGGRDPLFKVNRVRRWIGLPPIRLTPDVVIDESCYGDPSDLGIEPQ